MINAILLIFFGSTMAESALVTELACNVPEILPERTFLTNTEGFISIYEDDSVRVENLDGTIIIRSAEGFVLYSSKPAK